MSTESSTSSVAGQYNFNKVPLSIAAIALLAVPFAFIQNGIGVLDADPGFVLAFAVFTLISAGLAAYLLVFRRIPSRAGKTPYLVFFSVFAFAAVLDFLIAMTLLGYTDVMAAYFETGEPYLKSNHGMAVNLWDGVVHFGLYLFMSFCLVASKNHRSAALFWAGSMVASCIVYMVGNLIGEYAEHIEPSYLLNVPFMIVPIFYAWKVVESERIETPSAKHSASPADYVLALALLGVAAVVVFRLLVTLNPEISLTQTWATETEPYILNATRYPQIQVLFYGFCLMPFCVIAALSLWRAYSYSVEVWSWLMAGAVCQGQFAYFMGALHSLPENGSLGSTAWIVNAAIAAVPLIFAFRYAAKSR